MSASWSIPRRVLITMCTDLLLNYSDPLEYSQQIVALTDMCFEDYYSEVPASSVWDKFVGLLKDCLRHTAPDHFRRWDSAVHNRPFVEDVLWTTSLAHYYDENSIGGLSPHDSL